MSAGRAYYNEIDANAAAWLRNLIAGGHIAPGDVDERSVADVRAADLRGYTQCHFFAGIGVWSHALRRAGWSDDREVWTGSCPCQPFSAAGKRKGFDDARHLWPEWFRLIGERRPVVVFGEQVANGGGLTWFDAVQADLEGAAYTVGAVDLPACGVGAPHIRNRLFFVANAMRERQQERSIQLRQPKHAGQAVQHQPATVRRSAADVVGDTSGARLPAREPADVHGARRREERRATVQPGADRSAVGDASSAGLEAERRSAEQCSGDANSAGPVNGFWRAAVWISCRDGKARAIEPGPLAMANGFAVLLGRVRADVVDSVREEVSHAFRCEADAREALRHVWEALSAMAEQERPPRRLSAVHDAPVLFDFLRELANEGWTLAQSVSSARAEAHEVGVRSVRRDEVSPRPSRRRELDEQLAGERADAMRVLSPILARHAQAAWGEGFDAHAAAACPLVVGAPARVVRLRAYGNAIVAPLAAEFIGAYLDVTA